MTRLFVFRNLGLKVLSICIAGLLWLVVGGDHVVERVIRVPIAFENVPAGVEIVGDAPEAVVIRVRGAAGALGRLVPGDVSTLIDVRQARPGRRQFRLDAELVTVPSGIDVLQMSPSTVEITFESTGVRLVPVRVAVEGEPARGFRVGATTVDPDVVEVSGPESALRRLRQVETEPVSVRGASATRRETVALTLGDPSLRLRVPQPVRVTVAITPDAEDGR